MFKENGFHLYDWRGWNEGNDQELKRKNQFKENF
jgi:hypothetical protein